MLWKWDSIGAPRSDSMTSRTAGNGRGGTWSRSFANEDARSEGMRSRRREANWPALAKAPLAFAQEVRPPFDQSLAEGLPAFGSFFRRAPQTRDPVGPDTAQAEQKAPDDPWARAHGQLAFPEYFDGSKAAFRMRAHTAASPRAPLGVWRRLTSHSRTSP